MKSSTSRPHTQLCIIGNNHFNSFKDTRDSVKAAGMFWSSEGPLEVMTLGGHQQHVGWTSDSPVPLTTAPSHMLTKSLEGVAFAKANS